MNPFDCIYEAQYQRKIELIEKLVLLTTELGQQFKPIAGLVVGAGTDKASTHLVSIQYHLIQLKEMA